MPGNKENPGFVRSWTEKIAIPCQPVTTSAHTQTHPIQSADNNDYKGGSIIGGLLGAGIGGAISRGNGRWIGVPVGAATGALLGYQVDGG